MKINFKILMPDKPHPNLPHSGTGSPPRGRGYSTNAVKFSGIRIFYQHMLKKVLNMGRLPLPWGRGWGGAGSNRLQIYSFVQDTSKPGAEGLF